MADREFKYDYKIIKQIAVLKETKNCTKEVNYINYNGRVVFDIRRWMKRDNEKIMLKGISLSKDEMFLLLSSVYKFMEEIYERND